MIETEKSRKSIYRKKEICGKNHMHVFTQVEIEMEEVTDITRRDKEIRKTRLNGKYFQIEMAVGV